MLALQPRLRLIETKEGSITIIHMIEGKSPLIELTIPLIDQERSEVEEV
jgi:hypothetical protein